MKLDQTNLKHLKEKLGVLPKLSKRFHQYMNIINKRLITKQEVINLRSIFGGSKRNKLTNIELDQMLSAFLYPLVSSAKDKPMVMISKEHTAQGLAFLKGLYMTPKGKRKKINQIESLTTPSSYYLNAIEVEYVLNNFSHFQFNGFYEAYNQFGRCEYKPVWLVRSKDGKDFEYVQEFNGWARS